MSGSGVYAQGEEAGAGAKYSHQIEQGSDQWVVRGKTQDNGNRGG